MRPVDPIKPRTPSPHLLRTRSCFWSRPSVTNLVDLLGLGAGRRRYILDRSICVILLTGILVSVCASRIRNEERRRLPKHHRPVPESARQQSIQDPGHHLRHSRRHHATKCGFFPPGTRRPRKSWWLRVELREPLTYNTLAAGSRQEHPLHRGVRKHGAAYYRVDAFGWSDKPSKRKYSVMQCGSRPCRYSS